MGESNCGCHCCTHMVIDDIDSVIRCGNVGSQWYTKVIPPYMKCEHHICRAEMYKEATDE